MEPKTAINREKEKVKEKDEIVPVRTIKTHRGSRRIAPLILNLCTRWGCMSTSRLSRLTPRNKGAFMH
jgi:hypothetical protein